MIDEKIGAQLIRLSDNYSIFYFLFHFSASQIHFQSKKLLHSQISSSNSVNLVERTNMTFSQIWINACKFFSKIQSNHFSQVFDRRSKKF